MLPEPFSWRKRAASFKYAFQGLRILLRDEHNSRIHAAFAIAAIILGILLRIDVGEWIAVVACIGIVIAAEAFNSAIEALADRFGSERHPLIAKAKDTAAAGVLCLAAAALAIGIIIFLPKIIVLFFPS